MQTRAVLFANGEMPQTALLLPFLKPDDYYIAVDGGLRRLRNLYKTPGLVIGDFDSATAAEVAGAEAQGIEVRRYPSQKDETDLELALLAAVEKGFKEILLVGVLGGRLDHTLANLFLLTLPQLEGLKVTIENGSEELFMIRDHAQITGQVGEVVSLIPFNGPVSGVQTTHLQYPLNRETLFPHRSRGISNVMLNEEAEVSIESGLLLCIHSRKARRVVRTEE